jgi:hypothetical protein
MPIEIRELVIKALVTEQNESGQSGSPAKPGDNDVQPNEAMLAMCIEKILEILKDKNVR